MFKDKAHFVEELTKSIQKDIATKAEELAKAAPNIGGSGNVASSLMADARKKHTAEADRMEENVERLTQLAEGKPKEHGVHATLARQKAELEAHMKKAPK